MCANPKKTRVTAFHLQNKEAKRSLKVEWNKTELENTTHPKYPGVTLDRSLSYKQYIQNTTMKVPTRNNLLTKLVTSKWGTNPRTMRTTALALSYSTAEYITTVWASSVYARNLDPELNHACRSVTGCLKPTNVEDLYLLSGIAPPAIRRDVSARMERQRQTTRYTLCLVIINVHEELAKDYDSQWTTWSCLNRLRTGYTYSKAQRKKWKLYTGDTTCACGKAE